MVIRRIRQNITVCPTEMYPAIRAVHMVTSLRFMYESLAAGTGLRRFANIFHRGHYIRVANVGLIGGYLKQAFCTDLYGADITAVYYDRATTVVHRTLT